MKKSIWIQLKKNGILTGAVIFGFGACSSTAESDANYQALEQRNDPKLSEIILDIEEDDDRTDALVDIESAVLKEEGKRSRNGLLKCKKRRVMTMNSQSLVDAGAAPLVMHDVIAPLPESQDFNTDEYSTLTENSFIVTLDEPLSTFSIDVDNASYSNTRRFLQQGRKLPAGSVRIEEMINYFDYQYPQPQGEKPFAVVTEVAQSPWNESNQLVHVGIQGKDLDYKNLKSSNFVFLIDASGSMGSHNKLPLLKRSLKKLLSQLSANDRVAIVAYAGAAGLVLPSTPASQRETIISALDRVSSGGSTAGGQGIQLAYDVALKNLIHDGNNRVILATDGDFNVGVSSSADLVKMIQSKRDQDIFLTICGFGMGNYKDGRMEELSNAGNGNFFYIDSDREAEKVFVREMRANLFTIAKDVKIQVEFNPNTVQSYRLIGYVNRKLNKEDFNDDKKDAGELGAGHTVTAIYEIIPQGADKSDKKVDPLKYQSQQIGSNSEDLMTLKLRYKAPQDSISKLITTQVKNESRQWKKTSPDFRFSAAVAAFGMKMNESKHLKMEWGEIKSLAQGSIGADINGDRQEFLQLINRAKNLYPEAIARYVAPETQEPVTFDSRKVH